VATIANLHTSISQMAPDQLYNHIRTLRSLRREMPVKPVRKTKKKKQPQRQLTIENHISSLNDLKRADLLKYLLSIREKK
jgi:hypothetical protein